MLGRVAKFFQISNKPKNTLNVKFASAIAPVDCLTSEDYKEINRSAASRRLLENYEKRLWEEIEKISRSMPITHSHENSFDLYDSIKKVSREVLGISLSDVELEESYWDLKPKISSMTTCSRDALLMIYQYLDQRFGIRKLGGRALFEWLKELKALNVRDSDIKRVRESWLDYVDQDRSAKDLIERLSRILPRHVFRLLSGKSHENVKKSEGFLSTPVFFRPNVYQR